MKIGAVVVTALALAGCSKKTESAPPAKKGSDTEPAPPAPTPSAPAAKAAPKVTPEMLFSDTPEWSVEAIERGLWISTDGGPLVQACRVQLGMAMARTGKIRAAAKAAPDAVKCEPKGSYTVCAYDPPNADKSTPDSRASWVFTADDDSEGTVLIAVLVGTQGDWAKLEPELAKKQACPRPSDDPK
jgi:hypothetical protein